MIFASLMLLAQPIATEAVCNQAEADRGNQLAMNRCANVDYLAADEALNTQWAETADSAKQSDRFLAEHPDGRSGYFETLLAGQRAWLTYRDEHCRISAFDARGGSMEPMLYSLCLARITRERTEELKALTSNQMVG